MFFGMNARTLPGDFTPDLSAMLRVDHAGEYGAQRIYAGQLAVLKHRECAREIEHMARQEQVHLDAFNALLPKHRARPSALLPFWHVAGWALGAGSALLGTRAAMACTVAVETVITDHYDAQIEALGDANAEIKTTLQQFRDEEMEHHAIGLEHGAEDAPAYGLLSTAIQRACRMAIRIAERI